MRPLVTPTPPITALILAGGRGARMGGADKGLQTFQGRPLVLHLLAPNGRAVQVTRDLAGFWARAYRELRPQLSRRYPRHAWPEDPLQSLKT